MKNTGCPVPRADRYCEDAKDKEMGDGYCAEHSYEWRQSPEFREASKDDAVAFAEGLRIPSLLRAALRPFKKRWVKRLEAEQDGEEISE